MSRRPSKNSIAVSVSSTLRSVRRLRPFGFDVERRLSKTASVSDLRDYWSTIRPQLCVGAYARELIDFVLHPPFPTELLPFVAPYAVLVRLAARTGSPWAGFAAGMLYALEPFCIRQNGRVMLETAMILWVLLGYLLSGQPTEAALDKGLAALDRVLAASTGRDVLQLSALNEALP